MFNSHNLITESQDIRGNGHPSVCSFGHTGFLKFVGVVLGQSEEEGHVGRGILDHIFNTISKSAHHKGGRCLQLQLYIFLIYSNQELSGNKVMKEGDIGRRILDHVCNTFLKSDHPKEGPCLQSRLY